MLEVITGFPAGAAEEQEPRPDYDPRLRTLTEREAAKAAELTAAGENTRYPEPDAAPLRVPGAVGPGRPPQYPSGDPFGRVDERVVEAIAEAVGRADRRVHRDPRPGLEARPGDPGRAASGQEVPVPSRATVYRVFTQLEGGRHTFGSAAAAQQRQPAAGAVHRDHRAAARGDRADRHDAAGRDGGAG